MRISDWSSDVCSSDLIVVMERLSYSPAAVALAEAGARIVTVGLDAQGIDVEEVEALCKRHPVRAIFVTPHHQFPTTVSLGTERRLKLLDLARHYGIAIIEDDYDHEYHFESKPLRRSEERRVGKEWVSTCRSGWSPE